MIGNEKLREKSRKIVNFSCFCVTYGTKFLISDMKTSEINMMPTVRKRFSLILITQFKKYL